MVDERSALQSIGPLTVLVFRVSEAMQHFDSGRVKARVGPTILRALAKHSFKRRNPITRIPQTDYCRGRASDL